MPGRSPYEAWVRHVAPLREALRYITLGRFVLRESPTGIRANLDYSVSLNNMNSVLLKGMNRVSLIAGQTIRIHDWQPTYAQVRYRVMTLLYTYGFTIKTEHGEQELLTFHWSRDQTPDSSIPPGHLHIGKGLPAHPTVIRPGDFHNAHIPTDSIAFATVVRFAITELGAAPLAKDWESILAASEGVLES